MKSYRLSWEDTPKRNSPRQKFPPRRDSSMSSKTSRRKFLKKTLMGAGLAIATTGLNPTGSSAAGPFWGKYRGTVVNVTDPELRGRLQATVPDVLGTAVSGWAFPAVPFAGASHGLVLLPEIGDSVWIEFEAGDPSRPIWSGGFWNSVSAFPGAFSGRNRLLATDAGHKILIDEDSNTIQLLHAGGASITLSGSSITLNIGPTSLLVSVTGVYINNKLLARDPTTPIVAELILSD
jgi:hypothetical protein